MDNVPHLALPLQIASGAYVVNQQDTETEAATCVKAILSFQKDSRLEDPDFGIDNPLFDTQPIDAGSVIDAIRTYEPRVEASIEETDSADGTTTVTVRVKLPTSDLLPEEV